jgi:hypothetical protein
LWALELPLALGESLLPHAAKVWVDATRSATRPRNFFMRVSPEG